MLSNPQAWREYRPVYLARAMTAQRRPIKFGSPYSERLSRNMAISLNAASLATLVTLTAALLSPQSLAASPWNGNYAYERTYDDAAGKRAGEIYAIEYAGGKGGTCRITMTGPAAYEDILCRAVASDKAVTFHFKRYADEASAKANQARAYKPDLQLLTLEKGVSEKRPNAIRTVWHSLRTLDGKRPASGVRFKRVQKAT